MSVNKISIVSKCASMLKHAARRDGRLGECFLMFANLSVIWTQISSNPPQHNPSNRKTLQNHNLSDAGFSVLIWHILLLVCNIIASLLEKVLTCFISVHFLIDNHVLFYCLALFQ